VEDVPAKLESEAAERDGEAQERSSVKRKDRRRFEEMPVLQLGPFPPPNGGVQSNLVAIRRYLREKGIGCGVMNLTRYREAREEGVYHPASAIEAALLLFRLPCRIFHYHFGGMVTPRVLALSLLLCWMPGRKAVLTFHSGGYPSTPEGKRANPRTFRGFVFRRFDRVIAVNEAIAEMMRRYGVEKERIRLICPAAIDAAEMADALPGEMAKFYARHKPVLVTAGQLEPEYDLPLQIEVLGRVRERLGGAGLVILGGGSLERELRERIAAQPWREHILLAGDVPHGVTLRAIGDADVFLRTTRYDGDAISVREALYLGTPVIATENGMRPEGPRLVPVGDAEALRAAIEEEVRALGGKRGGGSGGRENVEAVLRVYEELGVGGSQS
jgi:glycogen(starch) synthase